ncbi:MAG: hypothetical protein DMG32_09720 [Acidobacteria bacterium]|nr:MAG: hypothetical protein DMG32_09720 [Acidobacteriota bacterium]
MLAEKASFAPAPKEPWIEMHRYEILNKSFLSKLTIRTIPLLSILLLGSVDFRAQSVSAYFGAGTARDRVGTSTAQGCPAGQLFDGLVCEAGPTMRASATHRASLQGRTEITSRCILQPA